MSWRVARSITTLTAELDRAYPNRTKPDWTIGDAAHRNRASDHNPNQVGVVCAVDIRQGGGIDLAAVAEHIRRQGAAGHPAAKYVISNRRIAGRHTGWAWRAYTGSNPHTTHMHVSVGVGPDGRSTGPYDSTAAWGIAPGGGGSAPPSGGGGAGGTVPNHERIVRAMQVVNLSRVTSNSSTFVRSDAVKRLQGLLMAHGLGPAGLTGRDGRPDGIAGPATRAGVGTFQRNHRTGNRDGSPDWIVGANTWARLNGVRL